jgi:hypothetical protein
VTRPSLLLVFVACLAGGFLAGGTPEVCGACPPSGGPGEVLFLSLDSVRVDGARVDSVPYGKPRVIIEGVGPSFGMEIDVDGSWLIARFSK